MKTIDFDSVELSVRTESFMGTKSLINKCASAGNLSAQYFLSKVILVTSSHLWLTMVQSDDIVPLEKYINRATRAETPEKDLQASFLAHFMDNQSSISNRPGGILFHTQLVRLFLCRCNVADFVSMHRFLKLYFFISTLKASQRCIQSFDDSIDDMLFIVTQIVNFGCKNGRVWSKLEAKRVPDEFERVMRSFLRNPFQRSALKLEELARERELVAVQSVGVEVVDLGEYLFHHLVKKYFDEGLESPSPNVLCYFGLDESKPFCSAFGKNFETARIKAVQAFDEALPPK